MRTFRDLPIRQKLLAITMITIAASLLLAGTGIVILDRVLFRAGMRRDLAALARVIGDNSTAALSFDDPRVAREILGALKARRHVNSACIYKPDGGIFAQYTRAGSQAECQPPAAGDQVRFSGIGLVVSHPIMLNNQRVGTLVMLYDPAELTQRTRLYGAIVLGILLGSSLLAFILSSRLRDVIGTPIARLAQAAASVSQTADYSVRVEKYSRDELGVLVDAFNRMLERVQVRDSEIETARNSLQTTLTSIGDAVISTDMEGRIVFTNAVARNLLRWPAEELAGKHIDDVFRIVNEFTRQSAEVPVHRVLREGAILGLANHTVLIARDGTEIPIDDSAAPIRDVSGRMLGVVLVFRDISERRRAEASARLLASIVESSDDAIISSDLNGVITSWNKGAERIFEYTAEETIGQVLSMLAAPGHEDEMPGIMDHIRRGERVEHSQRLRRAKSGRLVHASITVSPIRDGNGQIVGASKISRDITAQVEAQAQVAEQRERLRVTLSSIGDAVMATDTGGRVTYLNPVAEHLTGWTTETAAGRPLEEVFHIVNEESRLTPENPATKALRHGRIIGLANHTLLISRDGQEIAIDDSAAPIQDAQGNTLGAVLVFRDITARRQAERRLAEQSDELRRRAGLLERVHCFVRDLDDRIAAWNRGAMDLYGFSAGEAIGQVSHKLLKTIFPMPLNEILTQLRTTGEWTGQLVHTRRDGSTVIVSSQWTLHRGPDNRPAAVLEVNTDVTELRRTEEELRKNLETLTRMHELAGKRVESGRLQPVLDDIVEHGVAILSAQQGTLQILQKNGLKIVADRGHDQRFKEFFSASEKVASSCGEAIKRGDRVIVEDVEQSPVFAGTPSLAVMRQAGVRAVQSTPLFARNGRLLGVFSTHWPVPHVPSEDDLRRLDLLARQAADLIESDEAEQALRESEELYRATFANAAVGIAHVGLDGRWLRMNDALCAITGYSREELHAKDFADITHPDDIEADWAQARRVLAGEISTYAMEKRYIRRDGSTVWVNLTVSLLRSSDGAPLYFISIIEDATARKELEERKLELLAKERALASERALRETEAELARVVRALSVGELATSIAHEINQPLAGVVTNAEAAVRWLSGESPNVQEARESLALIARDGNRASSVIRRIREFLRKGRQETTLIDINEVVREAAALARPELLKRAVTLNLELSAGAALVRGDRIQLQQVILNLMMNGAEAMSSVAGGRELYIRSGRSPAGGVFVAVRDAGVGIRAEEMAHMFDPFFTTKPTGMGMGLSISRTIIEAHGGQIWAEPNDDRGLTVGFGLPAESGSHAAGDGS